MNISIGNHLQLKQEIHLRKIYITDIPIKFNVKIWLIEKEANQLLLAHQQKICNYVLFLEVGKQRLKIITTWKLGNWDVILFGAQNGVSRKFRDTILSE